MTRSQHDEMTSEKLYELARDEYASAERRFDDAEGKIGRYLSVLFVVLGIATVSVDALRAVILVPRAQNIAFGVFVAGFYLCGLFAFGYFVRALAVQQVRGLKLDESVLEYFDRYTTPTGLRGLAKAYFGAAAQFRSRTQDKLRLAHRGFLCLLAAVAFAVLATGAYFFVELSESDMSSHESGGQTTTNQEPEPSPKNEPSSDTSQAAEDAAQLFEDMHKSFEGGVARERK